MPRESLPDRRRAVTFDVEHEGPEPTALTSERGARASPNQVRSSPGWHSAAAPLTSLGFRHRAQLDREAEVEFLDVLDRAREASSARRDVDHALWAYDEQGNLVCLRNGVSMDISTLSTIHTNLEDAVRDLNARTRPQDPFTSTGGR